MLDSMHIWWYRGGDNMETRWILKGYENGAYGVFGQCASRYRGFLIRKTARALSRSSIPAQAVIGIIIYSIKRTILRKNAPTVTRCSASPGLGAAGARSPVVGSCCQ